MTQLKVNERFCVEYRVWVMSEGRATDWVKDNRFYGSRSKAEQRAGILAQSQSVTDVRIAIVSR